MVAGGDGDRRPVGRRGGGDRGEDLHVVDALVERRAAGERGLCRQPGHLLEERPGLVGEGIVLTEADAGRVHRQPAGHIGVLGTEDDLAVAVPGGVVAQEQADLGRPALVERRRAVLAEHLEHQAVRVAGSDPGHLEGAAAVGELDGEGRVVVVLDRLQDVGDRDVVVTHDRAEGQRTRADHRVEPAAAHLPDVTAEELGHVAQVAADVGQRAGPGPPLYRQLIGAEVLHP